MNNITLLVMAAGMGSRYGGLKQLDAVGPNGETIIDYSVFDAIEAGFNKVVFIIRREFVNEFKAKITDKYAGKIQVQFAFQDIHDLPNGFKCPEGREKPWGTGQAILSASNLINETFCVINADDFYGQESFKKLADFYSRKNHVFSMMAFRLERTLSSFGGVTRGICEVENERLSTVVETENVLKTEKVINDLIQTRREQVYVLHSNAPWFGVTYKEDKQYVVNEIQKLIDEGVYPQELFGN